MLGRKEKAFKVHPHLTLDNLVPQNHFYRQVEAKLDLSFARDLVQTHYSSHYGRPSIDPVTFFKLQLIMFFEGIRSERQLMEQVNVNFAYRWFIGYDLDEAVPDHSSLSKIRTRYGLEIFQLFFEKVVELCIEAGLVWGKELYFDGTKVRANAATTSLVPRWVEQAREQLRVLFGTEVVNDTSQGQVTSRTLVPIYDGTRITGRRGRTYERTTDSQVSSTDPDATPMSRFNGDKTKLGYHTHYVVDGGKARIILAALVTPASIMDNTPMLDLARWVRFRWRVHPRIAVGDTRYGTTVNIVGLERDGIRAYLPMPDFSQRSSLYSNDRFTYDEKRDVYLCPEGQELPLHSRRASEEVFVYRAHAKVCNSCPVKAACTTSKSGRYIFRSFFYRELERVTSYYPTEAYKKAMRKRQVWVEPLFGEAKQWHGMTRFRLRRLERVNIEGLLTAAGQNLKRFLNARTRRNPLKPVAAVALSPVIEYRFCPLARIVQLAG